jgi:LysM repeat protein
MRIVENQLIAERGDSLASVAHEIGVPLADLVALNENKRLEIGQAVKLPDHIAEAIEHGDADEIASLAVERTDRNGYPIAHGLVAHAESKREDEKKRRPVRAPSRTDSKRTTQPAQPPKEEEDDADDDEKG